MFNPKITVNRKNAALFECDFEDTALYPVQDIIAALLETDCFQRWTRLRECILGDADDEDIASEDCVWAPRYVVRFGNFGESHFDTRLIGHVEFLGGRPGALSEACGMGSMMKWGSLRCVLGDIVQWMLMSNNRYSFVVSSDEIMFLRMTIKEVKAKVKKNGQLETKTLCHEPRLQYSEPMKIMDTFDTQDKSITTRMGLFHLFWLVMQNDQAWCLPSEMGNCLHYCEFSLNGQDLRLKPPALPRPSGARDSAMNHS